MAKTNDDIERKPAEGGKSVGAALHQIKMHASESDDAPSGSLRFRDILGGEFLWNLVRSQAWLIILVVLITTAYVAVRYQCQQDAIDISKLEKNLVDAKFESLSSSSNLTRLCRQSTVMLMLNDSTHAPMVSEPPYIIEVPQ